MRQNDLLCAQLPIGAEPVNAGRDRRECTIAPLQSVAERDGVS